MVICKSAHLLNKKLDRFRKEHKKIGFVPTMGALHQGHLSLIMEARRKSDIVVCSIFVNPTQFNDKSDFEKYPITIEPDIRLLEKSGCDLLYYPPVDDVYPSGTGDLKQYDLGKLEQILEGKYRPGHFQGVCQVVNRLLNIVDPMELFLGQKDYQQCMVIRKLIGLMGKTDQVHVNICPTLRESNGLAMSSRNMRLTHKEKELSSILFQSLQYIKSELKPGSLASLKEEAAKMIEKYGLRPDYVEIGTAEDLQLLSDWDGETRLVALVAAYINEVRLIDNLLLV